MDSLFGLCRKVSAAEQTDTTISNRPSYTLALSYPSYPKDKNDFLQKTDAHWLDENGLDSRFVVLFFFVNFLNFHDISSQCVVILIPFTITVAFLGKHVKLF